MMPRVQNGLLPLRWNDLSTHSHVNIDQQKKVTFSLIRWSPFKNALTVSRLSDLAFAKQKCTMRCYVFNLFVIFPRSIRARYFQHRTPLFFAFSEQIAQRSMSSMQEIWLFKKPFRRGTATEMANSGHSLADILVADSGTVEFQCLSSLLSHEGRRFWKPL